MRSVVVSQTLSHAAPLPAYDSNADKHFQSIVLLHPPRFPSVCPSVNPWTVPHKHCSHPRCSWRRAGVIYCVRGIPMSHGCCARSAATQRRMRDETDNEVMSKENEEESGSRGMDDGPGSVSLSPAVLCKFTLCREK